MTADLTPDIIEQAARAGFAAAAANAATHCGLDEPVAWGEHLTDDDREHELIRTRAALSAAAPLIAAQTLEDAAGEVGKVREAIRLAQGVIVPPHVAMILAGYDQAEGAIREQVAKLREAS